MKRLSTVLLALLLFAGGAFAQSHFAGPWTEVDTKPFQGLNPVGGLEPMSGQVSAIAVDLVHDPSGNLVYVGSSSGGVWKSTNGLSASPHFVPISDQSGSLSVGAIALDTRTNPATIFVGSGAPDNSSNISGYTGVGILTSTDNGKHWTTVSTADGGAHSFVGLGFSSIIIDPVSPDTMLAATGMATDPNHPHSSVPQGDPAFKDLGIYRSTDAGKTWSQVMSANYGTQPTSSCCSTPTIRFPGGFFHVDLIYEPKQGTYFAGITGRGIFASSDHGATWKSFSDLGLGSGLPAANQIFKISLATRNGSLWAALLMNPFATSGAFQMFESTDHGKSWSQTSLPPDPPGGLFKGGLMYVAAPPSSTTLIFATQWVYRTNTFKAKTVWENIEHNLHGDQHAIAFAGPNSWYVGDDGGAWATTDGGSTWTSLNADLRTMEFFTADEDSAGTGAFAGGLQDNGPVLLSGTPGWQQVVYGDGTYVAADPQNPNAFFMSTQYGNMFYVPTSVLTSSPPIVTFITLTDNSSLQVDFLAPFEILHSDSRLYSGLSGSALNVAKHSSILLTAANNPYLVAYDPAAPFNPCNFPLAKTTCNSKIASNPQLVQLTSAINNVIQYIAPVPGDPTTAYFTAGSALYRVSGISFAGTATATQITAGPVNGAVLGHLAVAPGAGETLYLIKAGFLAGHKIFKTSDQGKTWTNISGNLPNVPLNWITLDPANPGTIYLATNTGVYVARDGGVVGENWKPLGTGLPNVPVTQLKIVSGPKLLAATYGRNVWTLADPCQTLRNQVQNPICDTQSGKRCEVLFRELVAQLKACEQKYGETTAP